MVYFNDSISGSVLLIVHFWLVISSVRICVLFLLPISGCEILVVYLWLSISGYLCLVVYVWLSLSSSVSKYCRSISPFLFVSLNISIFIIF